jgi:glycosyltransferase involved in cell wall biosynthesis
VGPRAAPDPRVRHIAGRLEWEDDPWDSLARTGERLLDLADEVRPDIVHLNSFSLAALPWERPTLVVAHSDVVSWHIAVRGAEPGPEWDRYRREVTRGLEAAGTVVAPTRAMARESERIYGVPATVVRNGIAERSAAGTTRSPLVLAAGRLWDEAKGLDALDRAAATTPWRVEVAGDATGVEARHVHLLGPLARDELRDRMAQALVFAHPARYEPFGLAPLEAAQAGCALVLGDIPTLRELWDGAARFVRPGDPDALAAALDDLRRDASLRESLAAAAVTRALQYDAATMASGYRDLYARLVPRSRAVEAARA